MRYVSREIDKNWNSYGPSKISLKIPQKSAHFQTPPLNFRPQAQTPTHGPTHEKKYENVRKGHIFSMGYPKTCLRMLFHGFGATSRFSQNLIPS